MRAADGAPVPNPERSSTNATDALGPSAYPFVGPDKGDMWSTRPPAPTPGCAGPGVVGETPASRSSKPIPLPEGPPGAPGAGAEPGLFPSKSASPMVGTFSPTLPCPAPFVSALDTGGGGATRTVPPVLAFRTATASAAPPRRGDLAFQRRDAVREVRHRPHHLSEPRRVTTDVGHHEVLHAPLLYFDLLRNRVLSDFVNHKASAACWACIGRVLDDVWTTVTVIGLNSHQR